eukprot:gene33214-42950_t
MHKSSQDQISDEDLLYLHILNCIAAEISIYRDIGIRKKKNARALMQSSKNAYKWWRVQPLPLGGYDGVGVLHLLKDHFPLMGESLTHASHTSLHLAVTRSSNAASVQKIIQLHPPALEMKNYYGDIPLDGILLNESPAAPQILQALLDAAPHSAQIVNTKNGKLPLHSLLSSFEVDPAKPETVSILLAAYRDAVNIRCEGSWLPVHYAAANCPMEIVQMIAEENRSNLSAVTDKGRTVAHLAVNRKNIHSLRYIHSIMPELLLCEDAKGRMSIYYLTMRDEYLNVSDDSLYDLSSPLSVCSEILRLILRHTPPHSSSEEG